jgi:hypothetical protein
VFARGTTLAPGADQVLSGQQSLDVQLVNGELFWDGVAGVPVVDPLDPDLTHPVYVELHVLLDDSPPFAMLLDIATTDTTIDVADARLVDPENEGADQGLFIPWTAAGQANGVAPLGGDLKIPLQFLPPAAGGTPSFEYVQATPLSVVTVNHGLGFRPNVSAFSLDWGDQYDEFKVQHLSDDELRVTMDAPTACVLVMS